LRCYFCRGLTDKRRGHVTVHCGPFIRLVVDSDALLISTVVGSVACRPIRVGNIRPSERPRKSINEPHPTVAVITRSSQKQPRPIANIRRPDNEVRHICLLGSLVGTGQVSGALAAPLLSLGPCEEQIATWTEVAASVRIAPRHDCLLRR